MEERQCETKPVQTSASLFSNCKLWPSSDHSMLSGLGVWERPFSEVQGLLLRHGSFTEICFYKASRGQSRLSRCHCDGIRSHGCKDRHVRWGFHQSPEADLLPYGVLQVLLRYIFWCISAVLVWLDGLSLQQAAESSIVDLCSQCKWNKTTTIRVWPNVPF